MGYRARLVAQGVAIGLVALLFLLLAWSLLHDEGGDLSKQANRGDRPAAPDFTLERLNGDGSLRLSSLRGKVVVINFWAAWCDPCKSEAPRFQAAYERYRDRVEFVGVDTADFSGDARAFLDRYEVDYPNVRDPSSKVLKAYGGLPIPRTFVVAPSGRVTGYIFGEAREEELDSAIRKALAA